MLVVVTVNTEVFPVRAVRGIVGGIAVPVVDREKAALRDIEFTAALGTDQPMDPQGLGTVVALRRLPCLPDDLFGRFSAARRPAGPPDNVITLFPHAAPPSAEKLPYGSNNILFLDLFHLRVDRKGKTGE